MSSTAIAPTPPTQGLARAKVLVCESNGMIRQAIRIGLNNLGIRDINEANGLVSAHKSLAEGGVDAVVMNTELEGHDTTFMLREIRLGKLGPDPFLVSILLQSAPDHSKLKQAVDSGTDDLLLIPFAPDQVSTRLDALRSRRKQFVVTHDYLGPDRRKATRPGDSPVVTISPPNPLASRAAGIPSDRYERLVRQARDALGAERIKRLAVGLEWECRTLLTASAGGQCRREMLITGFYRMETLLTELSERATSQLRHDSRHLDEMMDKVRDAKNRMTELKLADFDALHGASRRITMTYCGS
ncbi:MAG: response regulator [Magnetospirillum gryphiswaldense]|nr:response regulator [Magnetospirillum gryphiswaldense]